MAFFFLTCYISRRVIVSRVHSYLRLRSKYILSKLSFTTQFELIVLGSIIAIYCMFQPPGFPQESCVSQFVQKSASEADVVVSFDTGIGGDYVAESKRVEVQVTGMWQVLNHIFWLTLYGTGQLTLLIIL